MLSTNRRLAISLVIAAASAFTVDAAPAPPVDDGLESKDVGNVQEKDIINDLADEWASDSEETSTDEPLPLDDQQDVSVLLADATDNDELLETKEEEEGEPIDAGLFISEPDSSSISALDPETQELEAIAKNTDTDVEIQTVEETKQATGEVEANGGGIEYDVSQESFDEAAIETESESNDVDSAIWPEEQDVPEIKQVDPEEEEEVIEVVWDTEPDSPPASGSEKNAPGEVALTEDEVSLEDNSVEITDEVSSANAEDAFAELNKSEEDIKLDDTLSEEIDAEESNQEVDFGEDEAPLDINLSPSEDLQESETDDVYTVTTLEEDAPDFFSDESTAALDESRMDTDTQNEMDTLLDSIQQSMDEPSPVSDDTGNGVRPAHGLIDEAQVPGDASIPFSNAKGTDPFNSAIDHAQDQGSSLSLNLLLVLAIIVFLVFKSPKIKRFIFARESGSLPYHAIGRKSRD